MDLPKDIMDKFETKKDKLAYPCGMIAKYRFTDVFARIEAADGKQSHKINDRNVSWFHDRNFKFKNVPGKEEDYWTNIRD